MIRYDVRQGDTLTSIAFRFGFFPDTLWGLPDNAALKSVRPNCDILLPGDVVAIPPRQATAVTHPSGQRHRFKRCGVPARLRLQFLGPGGPIAATPYVLTIDGRESTGVTDGEGVLDAFVAPDARAGEVRLAHAVYVLQLGTMDPVTALAGVKKRLNNLGWYCGDPDAPADDLLDHAVRQFQARMQLPVTGVIDDATRDALQRLHDAPGALPPLPPADA